MVRIRWEFISAGMVRVWFSIWKVKFASFSWCVFVCMILVNLTSRWSNLYFGTSTYSTSRSPSSCLVNEHLDNLFVKLPRLMAFYLKFLHLLRWQPRLVVFQETNDYFSFQCGCRIPCNCRMLLATLRDMSTILLCDHCLLRQYEWCLHDIQPRSSPSDQTDWDRHSLYAWKGVHWRIHVLHVPMNL